MNTNQKPCRLSRLALACLAMLAGGAGAQVNEGGTQRIEIIGTTPLGGSGIERDRVPSNAQTASARDLDASQAADLSSFLARRIGSVHVNEIQNNPFQPDVNYRGFTASPLLGTAQGLSVYLDGVRMNQPFGEVVSITGSASNNLRFPGQYFLLESGLHYNWHRHYDPTTGRYLQADPLGVCRWAELVCVCTVGTNTVC